MTNKNHTSTYPNNLPSPLSTFIGRHSEIADITRLLTETRLLTLTGPGGSGKTRLALRTAGELQAEHSDGIWLVELASVSDGERVPQAVASALEVRERSGKPLIESLSDHLRTLDTLLVIDNCEHLLLPCAELVSALLKTCPNLNLLATSREPLRVPGEVVYPVPPLSLPEPQPWQQVDSDGEVLRVYQLSEAVQLFIARAMEASPSFNLTTQNGPWVAEICRRLDGIPLAIELAAAWIRTLSVREIAERLDDRFQLLTSIQRTIPDRHQTLEATLEWSYNLLSKLEQTMLQELSVFSGGWTLQAAEYVCAGKDIQESTVLEILSNLVDKSLVFVERAVGQRRYHQLDTIRQYSLKKLTENGELETIEDRHLDYYLEWVERASDHLAGPDQQSWLERFDFEHNNLRAALDWSLTTAIRAEKGLRLAAACGQYWRLHGYLSEGRERLKRAIDAQENDKSTLARASTLLWAAHLAYIQSDYPATNQLAKEGLKVSQQLGAEGKANVAKAYDLLGESAMQAGDYETTTRYMEEALSIYRQLGEKRGTADMLMQLGWAAMRVGDSIEAEARLNQSLRLIRELGESYMLSLIQSGLGELAIRQNHLDRAEELLEESLALRRKMGERWGIAVSLGSLGWVAMLQRDFERMRDLLERSLEIRMEIGDQGGTAWCLEKLAGSIVLQARALPAELLQQEYHRALLVFGAAAALRAPLNSAIDPADQPQYDQTIAELRSTLEEEVFKNAWEAGSTKSLEETVGLALAPVEEAHLTTTQVDKVKYGGLTPREREAAIHIAQGKSNREIAEVMVVRVKTVETYVTRILTKLGFNSRVQIATWAIQVGLTELEKDNT